MKPIKFSILLIKIFGVAAAMIGMLTIVGYIIDRKELYTWSGGNAMALGAGICFVITGVSVFLIATFLQHE